MSNQENNDLTLEKLKIHERLMAVEEHVIEAKILRSQLIDEFQQLIVKVTKVEVTIFGEEGMHQKVGEINKVAKLISSSLSKIMWIGIGYLVLQSIPNFAEYVYQITHIVK